MNLENFVCERCGACCKINGIVRLEDGDIENIAGKLSLSTDDFIERYTELSPDRKCLILKDREDGACILLTRDNLCMANDIKPRQCKTFPYDWTNKSSVSYCPALKKLNKSEKLN